MFACAHKSARAASNTVKRSAGPGSRPLIASGSWGSRQQLAAPICEGDSFRRGGPLLDHSGQQEDQKSHKEHSGRNSRVRKLVCFRRQLLGHRKRERRADECQQACDGRHRRIGEQAGADKKNAAEAALKCQACRSPRALT
jgi:hypothetical protein